MSDTPELLPRPCTPWQAIDIGCQLARREFRTLLTLWMIVALPMGILCLALGQWAPLASTMAFWWMKPAAELPLVLYLSRVVFGERPSIRETLRLASVNIPALLGSYLTLSRLSFTRGMTSPVVYLEKLRGRARRQRVSQLLVVPHRALLLQSVLVNIEGILLYGWLILVFALVPELGFEWIADLMLSTDQVDGSNVWWLLAFQVLSAGLVAPFFIAAGFLLYINRRMHLEAWDIAQQFHSIRNRAGRPARDTRDQPADPSVERVMVQTIALTTVLSVVLCTWSPRTQARYEVLESEGNADPEDAVTATVEDRWSPGLDSVSATMEEVFAEDIFNDTRTVLRPRKKNADDEETESNEDDRFSLLKEFLGMLGRGFEHLFKGLQWVPVVAVVATVAYFALQVYRNRWIPRLLKARYRPNLGQSEARRYEVVAELPQDIAAAARKALTSGDIRLSLSLLYRGTLRALGDFYRNPVSAGATEQDCLDLGAVRFSRDDSHLLGKLVSQWQASAWAGKDPAPTEVAELIEECARSHEQWKARGSYHP